MDCTLQDNQLDLRSTPKKNKDDLSEAGNPKIPARFGLLKEIFRLAAEVERCEYGGLGETSSCHASYPMTNYIPYHRQTAEINIISNTSDSR